MEERYRVMPRLAAGTGMRQMERSGLGADDIHAVGKRPRIRVARQLLADPRRAALRAGEEPQAP